MTIDGSNKQQNILLNCQYCSSLVYINKMYACMIQCLYAKYVAVHNVNVYNPSSY